MDPITCRHVISKTQHVISKTQHVISKTQHVISKTQHVISKTQHVISKAQHVISKMTCRHVDMSTCRHVIHPSHVMDPGSMDPWTLDPWILGPGVPGPLDPWSQGPRTLPGPLGPHFPYKYIRIGGPETPWGPHFDMSWSNLISVSHDFGVSRGPGTPPGDPKMGSKNDPFLGHLLRPFWALLAKTGP